MEAHKRGTRKRNKKTAKDDLVDLATHGHDAGAAALRLAKRLAKLINIESKWYDYSSSYSPTTSGVVDCLSNVPIGTGPSQRIGDSAKLQRLQITWTASINSAETINTVVRCIIFKDHENQGAIPAVNDVLETSGASPAMLSAVDYVNSRERFTILADDIYQLSKNGSEAVVRRVDVSPSNHVRWRASAGAATDLAEGHVFVLFISDEVTNNPTVRLYSRVVYTDD